MYKELHYQRGGSGKTDNRITLITCHVCWGGVHEEKSDNPKKKDIIHQWGGGLAKDNTLITKGVREGSNTSFYYFIFCGLLSQTK